MSQDHTLNVLLREISHLDGTPQTLLHGQEENFYEKDGTVSEGNSMSKGYSENKVVLVNVPEKPATFTILPRMT